LVAAVSARCCETLAIVQRYPPARLGDARRSSNWRVQNDPFWSMSVGAAEVAALQLGSSGLVAFA
jgi:hypothetical protein